MDRSSRRAVWEQLEAIEKMALGASSQLHETATRNQLKIFTEAWRELLLEHQPDLKGRCPVCSGWVRRRRWPCKVWETACQCLIGKPLHPEQPRKRLNRFRRPRRVEVIPRQVGATTAADHTANSRTSKPATTLPSQRVEYRRKAAE